MKLIQINACYGYGSTGIIVRDLQNICICNGIECVVAFPYSKGEVSGGYKMGNLISNKLHAVLARISGKQGYFSTLSTRRFLSFLEQYKPDIIHIHNLHGCYINLPMLLKYAAKRKITVVATLHDCWFYTGGCSHYTSVECDKWLKECGKCPRRYQETAAYLWDDSSQILADRKKLFGSIANLVGVGVSNWIAEEAHKTVFKNAKCLTIYNGIDTEYFHPVESDFRKKYNLEGKKIILAPANKWFMAINRETFDFFASRLTDDMRMVFIGTGCDESRLTDKMINIGFVSSREAIREIYSAADVMVNCTREESLSLLNVEVQACGTPIITYSNTGVKETVDGKCGFAVENGNSEAMWSMAADVLLKGKKCFEGDCISWTKHTFDRNQNYIKYIELYRNLISN